MRRAFQQPARARNVPFGAKVADAAGVAEALSWMASLLRRGTRAAFLNWEAGSDAAVKLATTVFAEREANPGIGRLEAIRRASLGSGTPGVVQRMSR